MAVDPRRWRMLGLLGAAQFMLILDVTVVAIALPHIGEDLGLARDVLTWVVSAYTLMFGGLMLLGGRAADLFGARRMVLAGLVVFTAASLVTGLANGSETADRRPDCSGDWCGHVIPGRPVRGDEDLRR
ncbi:MFS transporter [Kribbella sp. DT2]|uniref:MFS transporter n=1 Tax=Kribbella sp. DT2 TaxID=3393427 RepID=UPI003CE6EC6B